MSNRECTKENRTRMLVRWAKELTLVSWNDRDPKYDLREWSPDGTKMGKGITLTNEELVSLKELIDLELDG